MPLSVASILMIFSPFEGNILTGLINCITFFFISYILMDTTEDYNHFVDIFSAAYSNLSWYNWNVKCQKMYFIGTIHFSRRFRITLFLLIEINRQLLQKMLRILFPVANLLYSSRKINF
ncbi:uncharacterized protein [Euwallacea fornicatus]|uniref:uncharacterized protein n=1 Tax=Euwallacea fornicatus TaxID=995702 RepID=UPI00338D7C48